MYGLKIYNKTDLPFNFNINYCTKLNKKKITYIRCCKFIIKMKYKIGEIKTVKKFKSENFNCQILSCLSIEISNFMGRQSKIGKGYSARISIYITLLTRGVSRPNWRWTFWGEGLRGPLKPPPPMGPGRSPGGGPGGEAPVSWRILCFWSMIFRPLSGRKFGLPYIKILHKLYIIVIF